MKYFTYVVLLLWVFSCSPKYTASFQTDHHSDLNNLTGNNTQMDMGISPAGTAPLMQESFASTESAPSEFNRESVIFSDELKKQSSLLSTEATRQNKIEIRTAIKQIKESPKEGDPNKNGYAIAGFVLGILSLIPLFGMIAVIPAIIFSLIGIKSEKRKLAKAGLIIGSLGIVMAILAFIAWSNWG